MGHFHIQILKKRVCGGGNTTAFVYILSYVLGLSKKAGSNLGKATIIFKVMVCLTWPPVATAFWRVGGPFILKLSCFCYSLRHGCTMMCERDRPMRRGCDVLLTCDACDQQQGDIKATSSS